MGHPFTDGKEPCLESVDEEGESENHEYRPGHQPDQVGNRLLQYDELKERDHTDDGCKITYTFKKRVGKVSY